MLDKCIDPASGALTPSASTRPQRPLLGGFEPALDEPKNLIIERTPIPNGLSREFFVESLGQSETELNDSTAFTLSLASFTHDDSLTHGIVASQYQHGIDDIDDVCYTITVSTRDHLKDVGAKDSVKPSPPTSASLQPDFSALIFSMASAKGRRQYTLEVEDGVLTRLEVADCRPTGRTETPDDDYVSMEKAADILRHAASWLSRRQNGEPRWQHLGLIPRRIGRRLLFRKSDIYKLMDSQAMRRRGRPRRALEFHVNA